MVTPSSQRHPLQSFPFWFLVLTAAALGVAWKFELLSSGKPPAESFVPVAGEEASTPEKPLAAASREDRANTSGSAAIPAPPENQEPAPTPEWARSEDEPATSAGTVLQVNATDAEEPASAVTDPLPSAAEAAPAQTAAVAPAPSTTDVSAEIAEAIRLQTAGDDVAAHRILSTLYWQHPEARAEFRPQIDALAHRIYFEPRRHYIAGHVVQPGEVLEEISRKYQLSWEYLAKLNRVEPKEVQAGQTLKVIQGPFHAVVDLGRFELTVHAYGYYVTRFPIGIGRDGATPIGTFRVTGKQADPTYYGPDGVIDHDDPNNPLGEHWIAIDDASGTASGYGIHGTIDPASIGKAESKGCIRLKNSDVAALYDLLTVGSEVVIRR